MVGKKPIRTRGKLQLSRLFQRFKEGDKVAVIEERSRNINFPKRLQGRTGTISGRQGRSYLVKVKDQEKMKTFLIDPIHLKKLKAKNDRLK